MEFSDVSKKYPEFYYHDFAILETEDEFCVQYDFEIQGLSHFNPSFILAKPAGEKSFGNLRTVREAAFSLGLIELIFYWKLTCSPKVIIECGLLTPEQTAWWKKLYFKGLEPFFRTNRIQPDPEAFMDLYTVGEPISGHVDQRRFHGNLIPVGGGMDSFVSLQLLSGMQEENRAFVINHVMSAVHSAQAAGYQGERLLIAERSIDSRLLEFNKAGFLTGPAPFSALCAFAASLTAAIYGIQNICTSDGVSAGKEIAGYAESFEFEMDFKRYMDECITPEIHYFSLLRPLDKLQTAGLFSTLTGYHTVFHSCTEGQEEERWCGHCEDCLFACVLLSAFLSDQRLETIFGTDILNDETLTDPLARLCGREDGRSEAVNTAIAMSIRQRERSGNPLPLLYRNYKLTSNYDTYRDKEVDWHPNHTENLIPEDYQILLNDWLGEMREQ